METEEIFTLEDAHTSGAYAKRPVALARGKGARVWDSEGREYVDCIGGHGVAVVGHSHPAVVRLLSEQAERMVICPESFYNDRRAELYELLSRHTPDGLNRFFLCNSGAEAVEGAIKVARYFTGRPGIVAMKSGFHGRTLGALSATWNPRYRKPFEPLLAGFRHVPFGDLEAAERAVDDDTAAVVVEPVQGEGGFIVHRRSSSMACAACATSGERSSSLTRCRQASGGRENGLPVNISAWCRTSWPWARGSPGVYLPEPWCGTNAWAR